MSGTPRCVGNLHYAYTYAAGCQCGALTFQLCGPPVPAPAETAQPVAQRVNRMVAFMAHELKRTGRVQRDDEFSEEEIRARYENFIASTPPPGERDAETPKPCPDCRVIHDPADTCLDDDLHHAEVSRLRAEVETERMRLAACTTAALGNTTEAVARRIGPDSPYYSASYGDVCAAVDREIALRAEVERLTAEHDKRCESYEEDLGRRRVALKEMRKRAEAAEAALAEVRKDQ